MAEEHERCPDCGTPLVDLERRLEVTDADASHRHHAVDCVRVLKAVIDEANEILMDTRSHDIEHQIDGSQDDCPCPSNCIHGFPACVDCIWHDTVLHMST